MRRFFLLPIIMMLFMTPLLHAQEEEVDEELKSTIPSDPEMRGKKAVHPAPKKEAPAPQPSSAPPPSTSPGDEEGNEWQTMGSERHSSSAPAIRINEQTKKIVIGKISFQSNSDTPTANSARIIKQLAAFLSKKPELSIRIEGHSDSVGPDQTNLERSQRRADQVKEALIQAGVAAERLQAIGMGDKYPIASNVTPEGQEKNRRIEFFTAEASPAAAAPPLPPPSPAPVTPSPQVSPPAPPAAAAPPPAPPPPPSPPPPTTMPMTPPVTHPDSPE